MSSIDGGKARARVKKLFFRKLLPLSDMARRGTAYFPMGADPSAVTYYVARNATRMSRGDFEAPVCADENEFGKKLAALWERSGNPELAKCAPEIAACAGLLYAPEEIDDEVSPFIYVMF
ncbi:MAG TPA: hypothetical protein PLG31_12725 [Spirochaetota bacterium]|nr:hypothetical protein [Spirochaetota bacterium]